MYRRAFGDCQRISVCDIVGFPGLRSLAVGSCHNLCRIAVVWFLVGKGDGAFRAVCFIHLPAIDGDGVFQ